MEEEGGEEEEGGPKTEPYYPESIISIKRMGTASRTEAVADFFTSRGMEELVYDTSTAKEHEIFESLRSYIERVPLPPRRTAGPTTTCSPRRRSSSSTASSPPRRTRRVWSGGRAR